MRMLHAVLAAVMVTAAAAPADASLVYTRDGRVLDGDIRVEGPGLAVRTKDGKVQVVAYEQVLGISLDGMQLFPAPRRLEESKYLNNDLLVWSVVGANLAAMALAAMAIWKTTNGTPAAAVPAK